MITLMELGVQEVICINYPEWRSSKMAEQKLPNEHSDSPISDGDLKMLLDLLETIKFGSVTLIIQNGKVVFIEKNEKMKIK